MIYGGHVILIVLLTQGIIVPVFNDDLVKWLWVKDVGFIFDNIHTNDSCI